MEKGRKKLLEQVPTRILLASVKKAIRQEIGPSRKFKKK